MKFAVLFDLALQMQRNGLVALLRDILTRQKALIDASCLQYFVQVRGAGALQFKPCRYFPVNSGQRNAMGCVRLRQTYQMPRSSLAFFGYVASGCAPA